MHKLQLFFTAHITPLTLGQGKDINCIHMNSFYTAKGAMSSLKDNVYNSSNVLK